MCKKHHSNPYSWGPIAQGLACVLGAPSKGMHLYGGCPFHVYLSAYYWVAIQMDARMQPWARCQYAIVLTLFCPEAVLTAMLTEEPNIEARPIS